MMKRTRQPVPVLRCGLFLAILIGIAAAFRPTTPRIFRRSTTIDCQQTKLAASNHQDGSSSSLQNFYFRANKQQRDVIIVGGALAGLSAALYLSQIDPSRHITILDREEYGKTDNSRGDDNGSDNAQPASFAAAGMLAPQSERLPPGPLLDLCISSRRMFPEFCDMVESLAQESGDEGAPYLFPNEFSGKAGQQKDDLDPWSVGYVGSGGFLAPAFAGDSVATWAPPEDYGTAVWLDATQARELEPTLHKDIVGGWWFPDDASVDARRLTCSLRAACVAAGVQILAGPQYEVSSLDLVEGKCQGLWLKASKRKSGKRYIAAKTVLIANGAWMRNLLPVPIVPHKGQSLSLRMPTDKPPILRRVLFAQDSYIVPKADGRIVVGATVEAGSYDPNVTPAGLMHIMTHAIQLVPALKDLPVEETWAGLRPTTPDKGPILGETPWKNLLVAGGYWRNGVLLAPKTGQLLASLIATGGSENVPLASEDAAFLNAFAWNRFTSQEGSTALAASARYAASMHPIHTRSSDGVSAAVGTELGSYSSARAAVEDRKHDRDALWNSENGGDDEAFERAAALGKQDAAAFTGGRTDVAKSNVLKGTKEEEESSPETKSNEESVSFYEGTADAFTVSAAPSHEDDLELTYQAIQANKAQSSMRLEPSTEEEATTDDRPDPGFRISHVDSETGEHREVPPYTSPGEFQRMVDSGEISAEAGAKSTANASPTDSTSPNGVPDDLSFAYQTIQRNKAEKGAMLESDDGVAKEQRPDPGFRIYHVDPVTKEKREVPPYTSPGDFLASIGADSGKKKDKQATSVETMPESPSLTGANGDYKGYSETTFDGYQDIQQANSRTSREEELEAMREARRKNRLGQSEIDQSKIGVKKMDDMGS